MSAVDMRCGVGPLKRVSCLQRFAGLRFYTFIAGLTMLGVVATVTYKNSVVSTSQTAFSFSSKEIGIWMAMDEVGGVIGNIVAAYFLADKHIPRVMSYFTAVVIISNLMQGLPHFMFDYGDKLKVTSDSVSAAELISQNVYQSANCSLSPDSTTNAAGLAFEEASGNTVIFVVYCIAGILQGLGEAPFWCLGLTYIDSNVRHKYDSVKYIAFLFTAAVIGPFVGFGIGGWLLSYYVTLKETYLTPDDTQWIGAYWIGYLVFAAYLALLIPIMFMFPKQLPLQAEASETVNYDQQVSTSTTSSRKELTESECVNGIEDNVEDIVAAIKVDDKRTVKGLFKTIGKLAINPLYAVEVVASCSAVYFISGWMSFLPKYFGDQFFYSASSSNLYAGSLPTVFGGVSIFLAGWLSAKYKLNTQKKVILLFFSALGTVIFLTPLAFLTCDQFPVVDPPINSTSCVQTCDCDTNAYVPVCHQGTTYKSPCIVGCDDFIQEGKRFIYKGCLCGQNVTMKDGACQDEDCIYSYVYLVFTVLAVASSFCSLSVGPTIILRAVPERDRSLALGLQSTINSLVGWLPSPIIYGVLFDSACSIWEYPDNESWKGYCMEYDNRQYTKKYVGMTAGTMALTTVICGLAIPISRMERYREKNTDEDESSNTPSDVKLEKI